LTPPDPYIPTAERLLVPRWFQTLHPSSEKYGFKMWLFKFNLRRYAEVVDEVFKQVETIKR
jgi:hypothetical protein